MALYQVEYRSKVRKDKARESIALAMEGRWREAAVANQAILELFPEDVEALNRLGKALLESGDYTGARSSFARAVALSPSNGIAKKNLARLGHLAKEGRRPTKPGKLTPRQFLAESSKTTITALGQTASGNVVAKMAPGDPVDLEASENTLVVRSGTSEYLGQVSPRLALRLLRLMKGGNQYKAAVTSAGDGVLAIIIREVYQSPTQLGMASFLVRGIRDYRPILDNTLTQYGLPEEEELVVDEAGAAPDSDWDDGSEQPELPVSRRRRNPLEDMERDLEDDDG